MLRSTACEPHTCSSHFSLHTSITQTLLSLYTCSGSHQMIPCMTLVRTYCGFSASGISRYIDRGRKGDFTDRQIERQMHRQVQYNSCTLVDFMYVGSLQPGWMNMQNTLTTVHVYFELTPSPAENAFLVCTLYISIYTQIHTYMSASIFCYTGGWYRTTSTHDCGATSPV